MYTMVLEVPIQVTLKGDFSSSAASSIDKRSDTNPKDVSSSPTLDKNFSFIFLLYLFSSQVNWSQMKSKHDIYPK